MSWRCQNRTDDARMSFVWMMTMMIACWQSSISLGHYVSFYGDGFMQVPIGHVATSQTTLELHFRTSRRDALLFLVAGVSDYCAVTLQEGAVVLRTDLGAGETILSVSPSAAAADASFADLDWHYVNATWSHGRILLSVDRVYARSEDVTRPFTELNVAGDLCIGGTTTSFGAYLYTGDVPAFRGCMHHVVFDGVDVLDLAHDGGGSSDGVTWGTCSPEFDARSDEAISFIDEAAYVVFDAPELRPGGQMSFDIRTRSVDAVVAYDFGRYVDSAAFLLLEVVDGRFKLRLGGERPVAVTSMVMVNDGQWHRVELEFTVGSIAVVVDGQRAEHPSELGGTRSVLEPASHLFVGGVSESTRRYVLSRQLEFIADTTLTVSLLGCIRNLVVERTVLSWRQAVASRHLRTGCVWTYPCQSEPCSHGSRCVEDGYDKFHCRCVTEQCSIESPSGRPPSVTVEGPIRLRELIVEEGGQRTVSTEHIDLLVDNVKAGVANSRVIFVARTLPVYGVLFVSESRSPQTEVVSFSMSDLHQDRVAYFHDHSETTTDSVEFELLFDVATLTDVAADFRRTHNFTLAIWIIPVNDRPTLKLPVNDTLVLIVNTHLRLTASILSAVDPDDPPTNLEFIVDYTTNHSVGESSCYFTSTAAPLVGGNVTSFTQSEINEGHVRLVHRGPASQHLMLRGSDGKDTSDHHRLEVVGVNIRLRAVRNTGLVVQLSRSWVVITGDNLTFSCGAVHQNIDVRYELLSTPRYGDVQRRQHDAEWKTATTFTQRQIDDGRVRYKLRNTTVTTLSSDRLRFRVGALTVRDTDEHVLDVSVMDSRAELVRSTGLRLRAGARQGVITASQLRAVSRDQSLLPADIIYRIVSTPRRGHLLLTSTARQRGSPLQATDNFTQADVDAERIVYRLRLALMMPIRDDFEFQLFTPYAESDVALFEFQYQPPTGDFIFINNGLFNVLEGNHKLIGLENIYAESDSGSDDSYNVVEGPVHGEVRLIDSASGDVLQYNATTFSNDDIRRQRLYYVHDDSETDYDAFRFVVPVVRRESDDDEVRWFVSQFDIAIVLRNDNAPRRVAQSPLIVVENRGRVLTTNDLLYEDPDVNFDSQRLVYTWRHIANGDIVAAFDRATVVRQFTQKNLTSGELYFRHRGAAFALSEFTVSDGLFQVNGILDVRSVKPYLTVSNQSPLFAAKSDEVAILTEDNVVVETNVVYDNDSDVQFTVVKDPVHGVVEVVGDDCRLRSSCHRFTLADVRHASVRYRRNVSVEFGVERDQFVIVVRLDDLQTTSSIDVDLTLRPPTSTHPPPATLDVRGSMTATVDELSDVVLTSDQLSVIVTSHPVPVSARDIRYNVTVQPKHGVLLSFRGAPVRTFTQADVDAGRVLYKHRDVSSNLDSFRFRVRHLDDYSELISDELEFVIDVIESVIPLTASNLTTIEGQSTFIDSTTLLLGDRYRDSADVTFTVMTQPSHGQLESADRPGTRLMQFSGDQLAAGSLRYVHNGDESGTDDFAVWASLRSRLDRRSPTVTVYIDVVGVNDQRPTIVVNNRMQVWTGSTTPITCQHLLAKDDDTAPGDIVFSMLSRPNNGDVLTDDSKISNFTQSDINNRLVVFHHQGERRGSFQFEVSDGVSVAGPESFLIDATPLQLRLDVLSTLNAFPFIVQPITSRHVRASTNDPNQTRPIVFTVRRTPRLGRLVVGQDGDEQTSTTFSQADVDAGRVGYKYTATSAETAWSQTDSFVFDASTQYAESPLLSRLFTISLSYAHVNHDNVNWLMTLGTIAVKEGASVVIDQSTLDVTPLQRRLTDAVDFVDVVRYVVVDPPRHGTLQVRGLNLSIADDFSQEVVDDGQLVYQHDGSDTTSDHFTFLLDLATAETNLDEPLQSFTFNISVLSIDDQPSRLITTSPQIKLVQGTSHIITPDVLLTQDDDTPAGQVVYNVNPRPSNGRLQNADLLPTDVVTQFSQLDVDQLKISFVSDGTLDNGTFSFHVSDGVHKPIDEVFSIRIIPLTITLETYNVHILQGNNTAIITNKTLVLETNGNRSAVYYDVTQQPVYGLLMIDYLPVTSFSQADVDSGRLSYFQHDLESSAFDNFILDVRDSEVRGVVVEVEVDPLIHVRDDAISVDGDGPFQITVDMLDASELAEMTDSNPEYNVFVLPRLGTLSVASGTGRRRRGDWLEWQRTRRKRANGNDEDKVETQMTFTHDDVVNNRVEYTPNPNAVPTNGDDGPQEDGFDYVLRAPRVQPAVGSLKLEVTLPPASEAPPLNVDDDDEYYVYVDDVEDDEEDGTEYVTTALIVGGGVLTSVCSIISYRCYRLSRRRRWKRRQRELEALRQDEKPESVERHAADLHPSEPLLMRSAWTEPMHVATSEGELRRIRAEHWMSNRQPRQRLNDALRCAGVDSAVDDQPQAAPGDTDQKQTLPCDSVFPGSQSPQDGQDPYTSDRQGDLSRQSAWFDSFRGTQSQPSTRDDPAETQRGPPTLSRFTEPLRRTTRQSETHPYPARDDEVTPSSTDVSSSPAATRYPGGPLDAADVERHYNGRQTSAVDQSSTRQQRPHQDLDRPTPDHSSIPWPGSTSVLSDPLRKFTLPPSVPNRGAPERDGLTQTRQRGGDACADGSHCGPVHQDNVTGVTSTTMPETRVTRGTLPGDVDGGYVTGSRPQRQSVDTDMSSGHVDEVRPAQQVVYDWDKVDPQLLDLCRTTSPVLDKNQYWV